MRRLWESAKTRDKVLALVGILAVAFIAGVGRELKVIGSRTDTLAQKNSEYIAKLQQDEVVVRALIQQNSDINDRQNQLIAALRKRFPELKLGPLLTQPSLAAHPGVSSAPSRPTGHKPPVKHPTPTPAPGSGTGGQPGGTPQPPPPAPAPTVPPCVLQLCLPVTTPKTATVEIPHVG